ncbi:MAG: hypothetical protein ACK6CT_10035 [Planctomycetia bacterium]
MAAGLGDRGAVTCLSVLASAALLVACCIVAPARAAVDEFQQAVIDSLASAPRDTPPRLLEAAIRAAAVEVPDVAVASFRRLLQAIGDAGDGRTELLADLGEAFPAADLAMLERTIGDRDPMIGKALVAMRDAATLRRRDPARIARAAAGLAADSAAERTAAAKQLAAAREDALPALVEILQTDEPGQAPARDLARSLVRDLGQDARQPLLDWLGTGDLPHWRGIIEALDAINAADIDSFLLAPALVSDTPAPIRAAATRVLADRSRSRGAAPGAAAVPTAATAASHLALRLDQTLTPAGLRRAERLPGAPLAACRSAAAAFGGPVAGFVDRHVWDGQAGRLVRIRMPLRAARAQEAMHLARDMMALGAPNPQAVRLAILARLEETLVLAGDPATALERIEPARLRDAVTGPDGFADATVADLVDLGRERGMHEAAAAAATVLAQLPAADDAGTQATAPLPPGVRSALVRALDVPDAALQVAAARALAVRAGPHAYRGSSRVTETLLRAASARGQDRVVVAHPVRDEAQELAAAVSRFDYEPLIVSSGRDAVLAVRESPDVVLVILAARTMRPSALETAQFLRAGATAAPPVLVAIDVLDDDAGGCFVRDLMKKFQSVTGVALVDRLDSFFIPTIDADTGRQTAAPRFPAALASVAGPTAVDPALRAGRAAARLARAREALAIVGRLGRNGWDVSAAVPIARRGLLEPSLQTAAASLLATIGRAEAQAALEREAERVELPAAQRSVAQAAFKASVARFGVLLDSREMRAVQARYNRALDEEARAAAAAVLEVIDSPRRPLEPSPADAAPARSER